MWFVKHLEPRMGLGQLLKRLSHSPAVCVLLKYRPTKGGKQGTIMGWGERRAEVLLCYFKPSLCLIQKVGTKRAHEAGGRAVDLFCNNKVVFRYGGMVMSLWGLKFG